MFLEGLVPILSRFIELHNYYKILILEPIKTKEEYIMCFTIRLYVVFISKEDLS